MAQIMRYHKFPSSVFPQSFTCYLGSGQTATTITTSASRSPTGINWETGGCSIPSGGLYVGDRWGNNIVIGNANGTKASILALSSLSLSLSGTAGSWYNVERTYELNNPRWETVESFMIPSAGSKSVSLPVEYGVNSAFYRVVPKTAP